MHGFKNLKKLYAAIIISSLSLLYILPNFSTILAAEIYSTKNNELAGSLTAQAAVLIDADSGSVLFEKDAYSEYYPASITKVMTALLVIEHSGGNYDEMVTASRKAVYGIEAGSSIMGISEGESFSVNDLLYGLLLRSGNDAAVVLAEHISGSEEEFAKLMTRRAAEIGAKDTVFKNAHGLPDDGHYTTAYDMGLIMREAVKYEKFTEVLGAKEHTLPATRYSEPRVLYNQNRFIMDGELQNTDIIASKTGYTDLARHTLTSYAARDGKKLVCVVLADEKNLNYTDTAALFEYGFDNFEQTLLAAADEYSASYEVKGSFNGEKAVFGTAELTPESDLKILLPKTIDKEEIALIADCSSFIKDYTDMGMTVGNLCAYYNGSLLASTPLVAKNKVSATGYYEKKLLEQAGASEIISDGLYPVFAMGEGPSLEASESPRNPVFDILLISATILAAVGFIIIGLAIRTENKKREAERRRRRPRAVRYYRVRQERDNA